MSDVPAIFELDDIGEATGIVHPFHVACARIFQKGDQAEAQVFTGGTSRYVWGLSDSSQHGDHQCVGCGKPMDEKVGANCGRTH